MNIALWIVYDAVSLSFGPLMTHLLQISTVISGIIIHDMRKGKQRKVE